jgi:hypothetical protein
MRKTIIFAIFTTFLAGVSLVAGVARTVHGSTSTFSQNPVVHPQATGSPTARDFNVT